MKKLLLDLFGPSSAFAVGDSVEPLQGGQLMVVKNTSLDPRTGERLIHCAVFDAMVAASTTKVFKETDLKPIDWYHSKPPLA